VKHGEAHEKNVKFRQADTASGNDMGHRIVAKD